MPTTPIGTTKVKIHHTASVSVAMANRMLGHPQLPITTKHTPPLVLPVLYLWSLEGLLHRFPNKHMLKKLFTQQLTFINSQSPCQLKVR